MIRQAALWVFGLTMGLVVPISVSGQDFDRCAIAVCRLEVQGGLFLLSVPPSVYLGEQRIGPMRPSPDLERLFATESQGRPAYDQFEHRHKVVVWIRLASFVAGTATAYAMLTDRDWVRPGIYVTAGLGTMSYVPAWMARQSFQKAVRRFNESRP